MANKKGTYKEMLNYPLDFESTISAKLGLPPLPVPNKAEGVSVEPRYCLLTVLYLLVCWCKGRAEAHEDHLCGDEQGCFDLCHR